MLRLWCTNNSWLQGLWKNAANQVSFHMRLCSCRARSSGVTGMTTTPGSADSFAMASGLAACPDY